MPEYTTTKAAAMLGTARRNVQNYAKRHGLKKFGREYIVTETDIAGMRRELGKPGPKPRKVNIVNPTHEHLDEHAPTNEGAGSPDTAS